MSSQQEPAVYNLEYFADADFWEGASESPRRTFLMPLSRPAEFLAFGVYGPSSTVLFVARGTVSEHLGDFVSRMTRAGASVELYTRVPLPWPLVKRYLSDDPFTGLETDPPQDPPSGGSVSFGGGAELTTASSTSQPSLATFLPTWPQNSTARETYLLWMPGYSEFLALGVCQRVEPAGTLDLFVFVARGEVGTHLGDFIVRMRQAGNSVKLVDWPPLGFLQDYIASAYPDVYAQRSRPPTTTQDGGGSLTQQAA